MTRAWRQLYILAVLYAALQVLTIAWAVPALLKEFT